MHSIYQKILNYCPKYLIYSDSSKPARAFALKKHYIKSGVLIKK